MVFYKPTDFSYTNSCIAEHIASSVFNILGIRAQETMFGLFTVKGKEKLVPAILREHFWNIFIAAALLVRRHIAVCASHNVPSATSPPAEEILHDPQLVQYPRNNIPEEVLAKLMPWSPELPDNCRKPKN